MNHLALYNRHLGQLLLLPRSHLGRTLLPAIPLQGHVAASVTSSMPCFLRPAKRRRAEEAVCPMSCPGQSSCVRPLWPLALLHRLMNVRFHFATFLFALSPASSGRDIHPLQLHLQVVLIIRSCVCVCVCGVNVHQRNKAEALARLHVPGCGRGRAKKGESKGSVRTRTKPETQTIALNPRSSILNPYFSQPSPLARHTPLSPILDLP